MDDSRLVAADLSSVFRFPHRGACDDAGIAFVGNFRWWSAEVTLGWKRKHVVGEAIAIIDDLPTRRPLYRRSLQGCFPFRSGMNLGGSGII